MTNIVNNIFTTRVRNTFMLLAMFCSISTAAWGEATKSTWDGTVPSTAAVSVAECTKIGITGSGTQADPYVISTAQQFAYFASKMNSNTNWWKLADNVELDLNGTNHAWTYGQSNANFKGHFDGNKSSGSLISNMKFETNGANKSLGLFPQIQGSGATNHAEIKNLEIKNFQITTPGSGTSYGATTNVGLLIGKINGNVDVVNVTITGTNSISYDVTTTGANYVGALAGNVTSDNCTIKNCTISGVSVTTNAAAVKKDFYLGGLAGNVSNNSVILDNTVSGISITLNGNTNGNNIIGGLIGKVAGTNSTVAANLPMGKRTLVQKNTVTSPRITMNGSVEVANLELGGMIGWVASHTNVFNNKVTSPTIQLNNNINNHSYIGAAVGYQDGYTFVDGLTVSGTGSISGPTSDKVVKNNVNLFVGGYLGYQINSGVNAFQAGKFKNIAVTGMNINLGNYKPGSSIQNHKFSVGGIAGSVNAPNMKADGTWGGMPENLIFKGGKIYAPWASTSPTVSNFNAVAAAHDNMTIDKVTTVDAIEKAKVNTWYYNDYKLGLSSEFLGSTSVKAHDATPAQFEFRKNYSAEPAEDDGIKYLAINNSTFEKSNRYQDSERDSKTVLWWTQQASMDKSKGTVAAVTCFTANEQPIYPQSGATSAQAGNLTDYPYYMYFFQGVSNAKWASNDDATKLVEGIAANFTNNIVPSLVAGSVAAGNSAGGSLIGDGVSVTITNDGETRRGFDNRTLTVALIKADGTAATGSYTYQWYVDGVADGTGTTKTLTPHWKDSKGITVNVLNGSTVVATASYGFGPGMLHTQKSKADASSELIRSDFNGRGTSANPYIIDCENALRQLSYLSTAHTSTYWETVGKPASPYPTNQTQGHYNRAYYKLGADIDLGGRDFTPISHVGYGSDGSWGTYTTNFIFQGVFDGAGYTISNFNIKWGASQYVGNNSNIYYGLFGAVGNATAARKWGDAENGNTVIKNLIISGATLTHNTAETSFYYDQSISTNANYALVGVLAGVVTSNTTIQNIEIRNSRITDSGSNDYSLATKGLYVGGAIGAVQAAHNATANVPAGTQIQHIAAKVDITLTKPVIVKTSDATQTGSFNVGGIIGRYVATGATKEQVEPTLPAYTIYSGTIDAAKAWISPVVASLRYKDQQSFNFNNHSKHWEGNNNSAATQVAINNALYYNFKIGANKITDTYPANTCALGSRTMTAHSNASDAALTYSAQKYQGVNYGARYVDAENASLELLNGAPFDGYNWVWNNGFPHMSTDPYVEARISREGDTFTATLVGADATSYKWQASFDGEHWNNISSATAAEYAAPKSLKPKYIVAFVNDTYRTLVELVEPNKNLINPEVKHSDSKFKLDLGNGDNNIDHLTVTYEWFNNTKTTAFNPVVRNTDLDDSKVPTGNIVWCKLTITELGVTVYEDYLLSGATTVYVKSTGTDNTSGSRARGWTPETPVKTLDHANSLLKTIAEGGNVDNNVIVVMDELSDALRSSGRNPATITGKGYPAVLKVEQIDMGGSEHNVNNANRPGQKGANCYVLADTKFEHLTFKGNQGGNTFIECHGHDVTFGKGLVMTNFAKLASNHGNVNNALEVPEFTVILTATNLPKEDIDEYTNRTKPQVVTFQSGHYGRLMGGRFTQNFFAKNENTAHSILGSAAKPVWAVVNIEIDNNNEMTDGAGKTYGADINAIIAGLTDGTMYGDYTINFYGGHVAYIVGGNQGNAINNGDAVYTPVGGESGTWGQWPNASYFGRTVINIEDKSAENSSIKPITVGNLYAGGLGRKVQSGDDAKAAVDMYMYGRTEVNVKSGTISGSVYGGGVGGVIGRNPWDAHVPYDASTSADNATTAIQDKVQYGDKRVTGHWNEVEPTATMAKVTLHNLNDAGTDYVAEELDLSESSTTVNVIGGAVNGNVYGGGYGKVDDMPAASAVQGIGSVFGTTYINITGGTITGSVYGGSEGDSYYHNTKNKYGQTITHIAEMNGTVNLNISGTEDHYPTINGNIFGAGKGIASAAARTAVQDDVNNKRSANVGDAIPALEFADIARTGNTTLGDEFKSTINITIDLPDSHPFTGNIYGGGEMGKVDGEINVNIKNGVYQGNVFGAGLGEAGHTENKAMVTGNTYVNIQGANIKPNSIAGTGNVYGGGQLGKVIGNTNVSVSNENGESIIDANVYGGGNLGDVSLNSYVTINGGKVVNNVFGGGNQAAVGITSNVSIDDGIVQGNVFGGGDQGVVNEMSKVVINGGDVLCNVFGGGNKADVGTAMENPTKQQGETDEAFTTRRKTWATTYGTTIVMDGKEAKVYGDIFGGGNQANVEGNTSVSVFAGNFGGNIFGGGNGVLDGEGNVTTSADVTGNTFLYIAQDDGGQDEETKEDNFSINVIWDKKWVPASESVAGHFIEWNETNKTQFYADGKFLDNHNIYGGGNLACKVGTYASDAIDVATKPTEGTGKATVQVFKGMTPFELLKTEEWKNSYNDNNNPHFYVFGGGYGKNTKVGSTDVTVSVEGDYGDYSSEVDDPTEQLAKPGNGFANRTSRANDVTTPVFDNSKGIPNFTILGALGGGYSGLVADNTTVTVDGKTFLHRVYGGGFGDPNSPANNTTGQVGGNTDVHVNGAHIYGDVFGGGAGVASKTVILDNVARVLGTTSVTVADDANIYGKVYGGGDMACVGVATGAGRTSGKYTTMPSSQSIKTSGVWEYHVSRDTYQAFVNILGGNIFGEVYGGGKGVKKADAYDYTTVGRIEGNTLVHIACSVFDEENETWNVVPEATENATIPYVWNRIYGGCAYGTVDGNSMVHTEGGMLGLNIFGGGYGDMTIIEDKTDPSSGASTASSTLDQVLGKLDSEATFANILGNTKVQIDGGSWIWNRKADTNGNIITWEDANKTIADGLEGFKLLVAQILQAKTDEDLMKIEAVKSIDKEFFNLTTRQFFKNHNIFGGGNRACFVGTYTDKDASSAAEPTPNTGKAEVIINHSPIAKIKDADGDEIDMLDHTTVAGLCWYLGINNIAHPQFSVFGAGYGANTKVYDAIVKAQPGVQVDASGDLPDDRKGKYLNEESDLFAYYDFDLKIAEAWQEVSLEDKRKYYGLSGDNEGNTFLRYRSSQLAWSMGSPNFTFMDIHGGGFSGYVVRDAKVEADCQLTVRNIFGAGLGSKPYGTVTNQETANLSTLGQVGGDASVFFKSGIVSLNVYGGGAGVESKYLKEELAGKYKLYDSAIEGGTLVDFPNIARVMGKTNVDVYGESIKMPNEFSFAPALAGKRFERTTIFGGVYGGGDVANVGTTSSSEAVLTGANTEAFASTVNIRGGSIQSQIYAGGKGRLANQCSITDDNGTPVYGYKNLGAVYGNTRLIVDAADKTYPYDNSTPNAGVSPHIWNRIYGGCENGTVYGNTLVEINGGSLGHNIFGGGFGNDGTNLGQTTGDEDDENIAGTGLAAITSADVKGNTNIIINGGEMELTSYWLPETRTWEPATIKGATTYSPQYDPEKRKFKINHNTYGGGNAACVVGGSTYITMNKGLLKSTTVTIAGSSTTDFFSLPEWKEVYQKVGSPQFALFGGGFGAQTNIKNNTNITTLTNQNNEGIENIIPDAGYKHFKSEMAVMDIVGGGYSGKVTGETHVNATGGIFARRIFGGGYLGTVGKTNITAEIVDCHDIFGGGLMGDVLQSTNITIGSNDKDKTRDYLDTWIHGNIYGGNDVSGYINISHNDDGYFQENKATGGTNINIYGGNIDGNVYGAGNGDYLYALDREGHDKVTVNEHYPLDPNDANSQKFDLVYTVPMRETMPSHKAASDATKIVNINSWRPLTNRVKINIEGTKGDSVTIKGDVYGGGNSATVQKVYTNSGTTMTGDVSFNIGNHVNIGRVFMGCNGDALFTASEDNAFLTDFQKLNNLQLDNEIDWATDPSNHGISTLYLPTENEQRPIIYPHLLDLYFQPVEMNIQANLKWNNADDGNGLANCTIGTFCCGGNRGNMNVYPEATGDKAGNVLDYLFPENLVITDKIIGGCNNANYVWFNSEKNTKISHEGGYLLGEGHTTYPFIKLTVKNKFQPSEVEGAYKGGNVFGGCFETGTVRGDITVDMKSDMLSGKTKAMLDKSNELLATDPSYAALNVYGAGYGMESYVYGNTNILFGNGVVCSQPLAEATFNATGTSANFVYGGGQQGNVIGVTNVDVLNGHIYKSVTGGSYSGYVYGSTQIKVGYPTTYTLKAGQAGRYLLKRTDENNLEVVNTDASGNTTPTIKQYINLIPGDVITAGVYDAIYAKYNGEGADSTLIAASSKGDFFASATPTPSVGWDNINIFIDEACYGGGYSLAQGSSVMANNTTVLKYTDQYNINNTYRSAALADLTGGNHKGTTAGFGGNTMMLIGDATSNADRTDRDHITISHQEMNEASLAEGADLFGYYYKDNSNNYHYISKEGTYYYHADGTSILPTDAHSSDKKVYQYDGEGGIFGDGHLSYAEGFRAADLTGYGFADTYINNPKIVNTFQRMDILRLKDNCFTLLGARDYATNATNKTPYSISRVGEIQMIADNIALNEGKLKGKGAERSRNYMGLANNIHYVGAISSSVPFTEDWRDGQGAVGTVKTSYQDKKQAYIDHFYSDTDEDKGNVSIFQKRNDGTAKNMIGIASGYALKIQNVQEDASSGKVVDKIYYGPIYGVVEMNLIDVREDEGGGYVYADNVHKRPATPSAAKGSRTTESPQGESHPVDFLNTTGNFVFPYNPQEGRYIVDDCFPTGYDYLTGDKKANPDLEEVHYWYVTGYNYYYNVHITGYTYDSSTTPFKFNSDNKDGLTVLAGLKPGQEVAIHSWKMRSGHPNNAEHDTYSCDLETRNNMAAGTADNVDAGSNDVAGKYTLRIGGAATSEYDANNGFRAILPMNGATPSVDNDKKTLPSDLVGDAKITFQLTDAANNTTPEYYKNHLSEPCYGTVVLTAPAKKYDSNGELVNEIGYIGISEFYVENNDGTFSAAPATTIANTKEAYDSYNNPETSKYYYVNSVTHEYSPIENLDNLYTKPQGADDYSPVHNIPAEGSETYQTISVNGDTKYYYLAPRTYTYTIYLTIDYVQGPNITGHINVENCALPGEMVRVNKKNVKIESDESFAADGYYWRIGKRVKDTNHNWTFEDTTPWTKATATDNSAAGYDSYMQTELSGTGKGFFQGANYDKTNDYLDIPAYYYMNGYGIQLGVSMTGLDQIFPVAMQDDDQFVVHNYHRMKPHGAANVNLHLAEAVARAKAEPTILAEPRIYLSDTQDLAAFVAFLDSVGTNGGKLAANATEYVKLGARQATAADVTARIATSEGQWIPNLCEVPRYGEHAQFTVQNDMEIPEGYDVSNYRRDIILKGTVHGEGHVVTGLGTDKALISENRGHIHNLGMASGMMAAQGCTESGQYHCCFEYNAGSSAVNTPLVYRMDGTTVNSYTRDDFRYGRVAYDLNQYYLEARKVLAGGEDGCGAGSRLKDALGSNDTPAPTKAALKYVFDYWANGDYQYARRSDDKTSEITGVTYLRTGTGTDDPNYGSNLTRHNRLHTIDMPRAQEYTPASAAIPESRSGDYLPLFNSAYHTESSFSGDSSPELINDYLYWGQNLQQLPDAYPSTIESLQLSAMTNRVYRAVGYKGSKTAAPYHYNAFNNNNKVMSTYVHEPDVTAVDFTCNADGTTPAYNIGTVGACYYSPFADMASSYSSLNIADAVTKNVLIYTDANNAEVQTDIYDAAHQSLAYTASTAESNIHGHHIVTTDDSFKAEMLHLVDKQTFNAPIAFGVTGSSWYVRDPEQETGYVEKPGAAWESICLPFTATKATLSDYIQMYNPDGSKEKTEQLKDITFFYGKEDNGNHLNHQFWLRGISGMTTEGSPVVTKALFTRPDNSIETGGFEAYKPYIVSFPGNRFYEFDMNGQTITFSAESAEISVTDDATMSVNPQSTNVTYTSSFSNMPAEEEKYAIALGGSTSDTNRGSAFEKSMPIYAFRGYLTLSQSSAKGSRAIGTEPDVIYISSTHEIPGIDIDDPQSPDEEATGDFLRAYPIGRQRLCIESSYATTLKVFTTSGQLYRVLEVRPGTATYSGFQPGIYIINGKKLRAE